MIDRYHRNIGTSIPIDEQTIVYEYFKQIKKKDIDRLLGLFTDDAIVHEPFSKVDEGLKGKSAIKPFLEIVLMANDASQHEIEFKQQQEQQRSTDNKDKVTALVTFERGGRVQARFEFKLVAAETKDKENYDSHKLKKIQSLHIQFI